MATYKTNGSNLELLKAHGDNYTEFCKLGKILENVPDKGDPKNPYPPTRLLQAVRGLNNKTSYRYLTRLIKSGFVIKNGCGLEKTKKGKDLLRRLYELSEYFAAS
jgi:predicted transcriptional regulator